MNVHTFGSHSTVCPICRHPREDQVGKLLAGLFVCEHCQERLVISKSGHYVRDPFSDRRVALGQMLRRQSRPIQRVLRDIGLTRSPVVLAVLGGALALGLTSMLVNLSFSETNHRFLQPPSRELPFFKNLSEQNSDSQS